MPVTPPDDLIAQAEQLETEAKALIKQAEEQRARLIEQAEAKERLALLLRKVAAKSQGPLTNAKQSSKLRGVMTEAQKAAISGRLLTGGDLAWMDAARKAGLPSLRSVADALGVKPNFLSQIRSGHRPMPERLAVKFEALTGYPAASWRK